jgi:hypothetical protein
MIVCHRPLKVGEGGGSLVQLVQVGQGDRRRNYQLLARRLTVSRWAAAEAGQGIVDLCILRPCRSRAREQLE